jgi:hypothetical protein
MASNYAAHQSLIGKPVQSALLAIAARGRKNERQVTWTFRGDETPFQRSDQFLGRTRSNKAGATHHVPIANQRNGFLGSFDFVFHHGCALTLAAVDLILIDPQ